MIYNVEVKITLKKGMLNPEASTIERALDLLGYEVENTNSYNTITFQMEDERKSEIMKKVEDMCQRLLTNPVIHDYEINIS
ncbi:MAG: phosphoribosylformylglycinamidine synthase subunit PurS [Methanobrevibacter sp.]|jgi:phosphoribosylformylglycinamidine synthase|nr:phosphoribosylformylglycinamidine synthase subunit PurS [Candidatus Methanovirga basalitermitum]